MLQRVRHKFRGLGYITEQCKELEKWNYDPSSIFIQLDDDRNITEVSRSLVEEIPTCQANRDGECGWSECPMLKEQHNHCPYNYGMGEDY